MAVHGAVHGQLERGHFLWPDGDLDYGLPEIGLKIEAIGIQLFAIDGSAGTKRFVAPSSCGKAADVHYALLKGPLSAGYHLRFLTK